MQTSASVASSGAAGAAGAVVLKPDYRIQYQYLSVTVQHTSGALPSRYTVNLEQLQDCLCDGGFLVSTEFFECWERHMQHRPQTVVTVPWGDDRKCTTPDEAAARFAHFAATLGLGFRGAMNASHPDFNRYSMGLSDMLHFIQSMIDLPRNACFEPLEDAPKCASCGQTVMTAKPHGPMLRLVP